MEKVNGKWIAPEHFDSEEERKKAMNGWQGSPACDLVSFKSTYKCNPNPFFFFSN